MFLSPKTLSLKKRRKLNAEHYWLPDFPVQNSMRSSPGSTYPGQQSLVQHSAPRTLQGQIYRIHTPGGKQFLHVSAVSICITCLYLYPLFYLNQLFLFISAVLSVSAVLNCNSCFQFLPYSAASICINCFILVSDQLLIPISADYDL